MNDINKLIGPGLAFAGPFECHSPNGCPSKTYIWDKFGNCIAEVRGASHLQESMKCSSAAEVQEMQETIGNHIAERMNMLTPEEVVNLMRTTLQCALEVGVMSDEYRAGIRRAIREIEQISDNRLFKYLSCEQE